MPYLGGTFPPLDLAGFFPARAGFIGIRTSAVLSPIAFEAVRRIDGSRQN
jgi:hypothetical protein